MLKARTWGAITTAMLGLCLALSGCSGTAGTPGAPEPEEGLSFSPASNLVYKCLTDKGWTVALTWDGGIEASSKTIPQAQTGQYNADSDECWAKVDSRIVNMQPDEISKTYQSEMETRECLIEHGFEVGTPPSEQKYVDDFQGERWSAYADSNLGSNMAEDEWKDINVACPQPAWSLGVPQ